MKRILLFLIALIFAIPAFANSNNGSLVGAPTFGAAKFTNGLTATSNSNYILIPNTVLNVTSSSSWTVEAWLKTTVTGSTQLAFSYGTSTNAVWFGVASPGHFVVSASGFSGGAALDSGISISNGAWHHCVMQMTGGTSIATYVDGVAGATFSGTMVAFTATSTAIANYGSFPSSGFGWGGSIDEVAIFTIAKYSGTFTPNASAYTGAESRMTSLYHLESDASDSSTNVMVATTTLPNGTTSAGYSSTLATSGGTAPFTWALSTGSLPAGITLSSGGVLSGTPSATGTSTFTVQVTDTGGNTALSSTLTILVITGTSILPNNAAIVYSPYNWVVTSGSATTINSGAYFRVVFSGTQVAVQFNTANNTAPYSQLWGRIDGGAWTQYTINPGAASWAVGISLQNRKHLLEVVVKSTSETITRWASNAPTMVTISGIVLDSGASVSAPLARTKRILMFGDSITEGVRTVNSTATNDTDRNDVLSDYSYALSMAADAEVGIVGFGGSGITATGSGGVPVLATSYSLVYPGAARSFSTCPDLVVYNEGTNDGASNITAGLTTVVNGILSACPSSKHLLLVPFNGSHSTDIQAVVTGINSANVTWQSTTGWFNSSDSSDGTHPYGYAHLGYIAPKLFPVVQPLLGASHSTVGFFTSH